MHSADAGTNNTVRDSLMLYSSVRLSLFWDEDELVELEKKAQQRQHPSARSGCDHLTPRCVFAGRCKPLLGHDRC